MIGGMTVLARGSGPDATRWELNVSGDVDDLRTMVNITLADGRRPWRSGCGARGSDAARRRGPAGRADRGTRLPTRAGHSPGRPLRQRRSDVAAREVEETAITAA